MADEKTPTRVIWKHQLDQVALTLPDGARVLHVGPDPNGAPCLWEMHDEDAGPGPARRFTAVFTGEPFPGGTHLGTWLSGPLVWHLFETTAVAS